MTDSDRKQMNMGHNKRLTRLKCTLRKIAEYPPEGHDRRSWDGFPSEIEYDEFAYKRIVSSFRNAINDVLAEAEK